MNAFKYQAVIRNPPETDECERFEFTGDGDTFGEMVAEILTALRTFTGAEPNEETVSDFVNHLFDAWQAEPMKAERREFSDPEANFDVIITERQEHCECGCNDTDRFKGVLFCINCRRIRENQA